MLKHKEGVLHFEEHAFKNFALDRYQGLAGLGLPP